MKSLIVAIFFLTFSQPALSYSSFSLDLDNWQMQNDLDDMKRKQAELERKQECIEDNQRQQQQYQDCLSNCRMFNSSPCFCSKPITSICI